MRCPNPECPDAQLLHEGASYVEGVTTCPRCGATLVEVEPEPEPEPGVAEREAEPDLVELATFMQRQDADMALSCLAADGIQSLVMADDCGMVNAGVGIANVRLLVAAEDLERARELLASDAGEVEGEP
ncbi:MAG: DUF2007 domain-containing protein [Thermoanaerobaculaceae bacterium]|jgi:hypothetical protein|nr:DUF2007 domain-containing protein [Thermoanaerobaculaceae bacterium]